MQQLRPPACRTRPPRHPPACASGPARHDDEEGDNGHALQDYFRTLPLPHVVYLHTAFFYENVATKRGTKRVKVDKQVGGAVRHRPPLTAAAASSHASVTGPYGADV